MNAGQAETRAAEQGRFALPRFSAILEFGWNLVRRVVYSKYRLGAAAIITNGQGEVLLVKHSYAQLNWELPGGAADPGESIVETALREVREETGLEVVAEHVTGIYYESDLDMLCLAFWCTVPDGRFDLRLDNEEISQCAFWPADNLPKPISDYTIRRIQDALSGAKYPLPTVVGPRQWFD